MPVRVRSFWEVLSYGQVTGWTPAHKGLLSWAVRGEPRRNSRMSVFSMSQKLTEASGFWMDRNQGGVGQSAP